MKFGDMTYEEIRDCAAAGALAVVPTGCTEQQGPHLPVDFDTWFAETLTFAAAERARELYRAEVVVLPVIPFGPTPEHRGFGAGFVDVPSELHGRLVEATLESLADQGFRRILIWQGCGGHRLAEVVERFNRAHQGSVRASLPTQPYHAIWCRLADPSVPNLHAGSFTTSIATYMRPHSVRVENIPPAENVSVGSADTEADWSRYSRSGVIGDPTQASAELGRLLWEACVDEVAKVFWEACTAGLD